MSSDIRYVESLLSRLNAQRQALLDDFDERGWGVNVGDSELEELEELDDRIDEIERQLRELTSGMN